MLVRERKKGNGGILMKKLLALVLVLCMTIPVVSAFAIDQHEPEYFEQQVQLLADNLQKWYEENYGEGELVAPYDEPVDVHIATYYTATTEANMATWNEWWGETLENDRYVEAVRRAFNINIIYDWQKNQTDYETQLRLAITAGEIPDMFLVTDQNDLMQLA